MDRMRTIIVLILSISVLTLLELIMATLKLIISASY